MAPNGVEIERLVENLKNFDGMLPIGFEVCVRSIDKDNPIKKQLLPVPYLQKIRTHAARTAVYLEWLLDDRQFSDRDGEYLSKLDSAVRHIPYPIWFSEPFEFWFDYDRHINFIWTKPPRFGASFYRKYQSSKFMAFPCSKEWENFSDAFLAYRNLRTLGRHSKRHYVSLDLVGAFVENPTWLRVVATGSSIALVIFALILGGSYLLQTLDARECRRHFMDMIGQERGKLDELIKREGRSTAEQEAIIEKTNKIIVAGMAFCPPPNSNFELRVRGPFETDFSIRMGHGNP
jgi:hypothetical protein